jgi:hypothetical protein
VEGINSLKGRQEQKRAVRWTKIDGERVVFVRELVWGGLGIECFLFVCLVVYRSRYVTF